MMPFSDRMLYSWRYKKNTQHFFSITKKFIMLYMIFQSSSLNHYQNQSYCIYNVSYITLRRLGNQLISHKVFLKFLEMISLAIDYYLVKQKSIYFTI